MRAGNAGDGDNLAISNSTRQNLFKSTFGKSLPVTILLIDGVGMVLVSLVGIIGNILALVVLTRPTMRTGSTSVILIFLAICDLAFVIVNLLLSGLRVLFAYLSFWPYYEVLVAVVMRSYLTGIFNVAQVGSVYFTVEVSVERLIVVYRPLRAHSLCTVRNVLRASLALAGLVILYTLPYWFKWTYDVVNEDDYNEPTYVLRHTKLYDEFESAFEFHSIWGDLLVERLIPFTLLIIFNVLIYNKVREANRQRKEMTEGQGRGRGSDANETSITKMLLWVVTIFIVCNSVRVYQDLVSIFGIKDSFAGQWEAHAFARLMLDLNSAANIFVYCFVGNKFRQTFLQIFCKRPQSSNRTSQSSLATASSQLTNSEGRASRTSSVDTTATIVSVEGVPMQELGHTPPPRKRRGWLNFTQCTH